MAFSAQSGLKLRERLTTEAAGRSASAGKEGHP